MVKVILRVGVYTYSTNKCKVYCILEQKPNSTIDSKYNDND